MKEVPRNRPEEKRARNSLVNDTAELAEPPPTERVSWDKFSPYSDVPFPLVPLGTLPSFREDDSPALCHYVHRLSGRARACTVHVKSQPGQATKPPRPIPTPMFMPVGTKGCIKGVPIEELTTDPALSCPIILGNTYHLAIQPGTDLIDEFDGLHSFQGLPKTETSTPYNLLTDSGGFQMVSLVKLSEVTEEGVSFENPFQKGSMLLLRPEDSIKHQNNIGANIIMALDDVVSSVSVNEERFTIATQRTLRWYDRCYKSHAKSDTQNLFPIVQGGLDTRIGGLREQCLSGFRKRAKELNYNIPGYAIGGLAGGEEKDSFWRVVDQCCKALPDDKPRYLMGVGYPLDLVVCTALGCDMYDCVYPTRTARFGTALVDGPAPGTMRLRQSEYSQDSDVIQTDCGCQACRLGVSRKRLHYLLKAGNPLATQLITQHNIAYMMSLVRQMREAILADRYSDFVRKFLKTQYPDGGEEPCPSWVIDALQAAGISL